MEEFLNVLVAGIPLALLVGLGVQGLKAFGVSNNLPRYAILFGAFFALGSLAVELFPVAEPYVGAVIRWYTAALGSGLGYAYFVKPLFEKLGWTKSLPISS